MFESIQILFWPEMPSCILRNQVKLGKNGNVEIIKENLHLQQRAENERSCCLVGVEILDSKISNVQLKGVIDEVTNSNCCGVFVEVLTLPQAQKIASYLKQRMRGNVELYGVDPCYYRSMVPLDGNSRKHIERYIVDLKSEFNMKDRVKAILKYMCIFFGRSEPLYENFLILSD